MLRYVLVVVALLVTAPALAHAEPTAESAAVCADYDSQAEAQRAADTVDSDGDGIYCEALPCPCSKPGGSGDTPPSGPGPPAPPTQVTHLSGRIVDVIDGDTIRVRANGKRYTVRLIGIDTPETKKPGTPVECGGLQATNNMLKLGFTRPSDTNADGLYDKRGGTGRAVKLLGDSTQDRRDGFGRLLAYVRTSKTGKNLAREQLAAGWSDLYVFERRFEHYSRFRAARNRAKDADRSGWSLCGGDFHRPAAPGLYFFNIRQGYLVAPERLDFCSSGCEYDRLTWTGWNTPTAVGTGFFAPVKSGEVEGRYPVTIMVSEPKTCANGVSIYTSLVETLTGELPPYPDLERTTTTRWRCNGSSDAF